MAYRRIQQLRRIVAILLVLVALVTVWSFVRRRATNKLAQEAARRLLPKEIQTATVGFSFSKTVAGRTLFSIKASRNLGLRGDKNILEDVEVLIYGKQGERFDRIRSARCDYDQARGAVYFEGEVEILLSSKGHAQQVGETAGASPPGFDFQKTMESQARILTSRLSYFQNENRAETNQLVQFAVGNLSGSGRGLNYRPSEGAVRLLSDVQLSMDRHGSRTLIRSGAFHFSKESRALTFIAPVKIVQENKEIEANEMTALLDEANHIRQIRLTGRPVVRMHPPSAMAARRDRESRPNLSLESDEMQADLQDEGRILERITASGHVVGHSREADGESSIESQRLTAYFTGQENTLTRLVADEQVVVRTSSLDQGITANGSKQASNVRSHVLQSPHVELFASGQKTRSSDLLFERWEASGPSVWELYPTDRRKPVRRIRGQQFIVRFASSRNTIEDFVAESDVRVEVEPTDKSQATTRQESRSQRLHARFDASTSGHGDLIFVEQTGRFHFAEYEIGTSKIVRQASSEQAFYQVATGTTRLVGKPAVWDDQSRTTAQEILFESESERFRAAGQVLTSSLPRNANTVPTPFPNEAPILISARELLADARAKTADYRGSAKMWQGDNVIRAERIELDGKARTMRALPQVNSSLLSISEKNPSDVRLVTVVADQLFYEESQRRAHYQGRVTLRADLGILTAKELDLLFAPSSGASSGATVPAQRLKSAVARGDVTIVQPTRRAKGEQAEYFTDEEKILLTGNQPTIVDAERGVTTGRQLTFYNRDDRIFVDGDMSERATTKRKIHQ